MHQPLQLIMGKFEAKTFLLEIVLLDEVIRTFNLESEMPMSTFLRYGHY